MQKSDFIHKFIDKRGDFSFEIVIFPFLDGDVPHAPSYGVYILQLIRFARIFSNVSDSTTETYFYPYVALTVQRYHKLRKAFSKFYQRHSELILKYNVDLETLLQQDISEPVFYGDLVYKFKNRRKDHQAL